MDVETIQALERVLRAAAEECAAIADEARAERRDWTSQELSPLGRRRHVAAVRRLIAAGNPGAALVGRRALLSAAALTVELNALSRRTPKAAELATVPTLSGPDALRRKLGLVVGGAR